MKKDLINPEYIENYFTVEFVSIPENFNVEIFMTMRERCGITNFSNINFEHIKMMCECIKSSPVMTICNNQNISTNTYVYLLFILEKIGAVVKSISNPLRLGRTDYERWINDLNRRGNHEIFYLRGNHVKHLHISIINIYAAMNSNQIQESINIAKEIERKQKEITDVLERI